MAFATNAESRYALTCIVGYCVPHLVIHVYFLSNSNLGAVHLVGLENCIIQRPTVLHHRLGKELLYGLFLAASSDNVDDGYIIGKVAIFDLSKTGHCIDEEDSLVGVAACEWVTTLYIPVDMVDHVGEEGGDAALYETVEDLFDMDSRCVCAVCCRRWRRGV